VSYTCTEYYCFSSVITTIIAGTADVNNVAEVLVPFGGFDHKKV